MTDPAERAGAPRNVLLATDLSARGDRALERAVLISRTHGANLVVVHAIEELDDAGLSYRGLPAPSWRRPPDPVRSVKRRIALALRADLGEDVERATVVVEPGDPADVIARVVESERIDLVVTGIAREGLFARQPVVVGRTVEQLVRRVFVPILVVRNRARSAYQRVMVTTDFSAPSGFALQAALRFFPDRPVVLFHAAEAPYATLVTDPGRHAERHSEARSTDMNAFLDSMFLPEPLRERVVPVVEPGAPLQVIREYVEVHDMDLVVLGTHGRGSLMQTLVGSVAKGILSTLPCDALVVRGPRQ